MKALSRYTVAASLVAALTLAAVLPFLGPPGNRGLILAVVVALPLAVVFFRLVADAREHTNRFLLFWGLGILGRMGAVALVALSMPHFDTIDPAVAIMSTVGLFFILLLLEPVFLPRAEEATGYTR